MTPIALSLATAAIRGTHALELVVLAIGAAVGLIGIDVVYVYRGVIQPIYLVDVAAQLVLILGWTIVLVRSRHKR